MALILLSWLLTAAFPELPMRSVLSSEGIRWFFGSFVDNLLSPLLIYLITIMIAYGAFLRSRLFTTTRMMLSNIKNRLTNAPQKTYKFHYRENVGLRIALAELIAYIIIMMLLTTVPHAILLSVTGQLFPSSFSSSFIPSLSFLITIMSLTYGVASQHAQNTCLRLRDRLKTHPHLPCRHSIIHVNHLCPYLIASL